MTRCRAQIPNAKAQTPKNIPHKNSEAGAIRALGIHLNFLWDLMVGLWDFSAVLVIHSWSLEFGGW
jgi:hypothetical protein